MTATASAAQYVYAVSSVGSTPDSPATPAPVPPPSVDERLTISWHVSATTQVAIAK